jgi:collagenase-like PrtC family protease
MGKRSVVMAKRSIELLAPAKDLTCGLAAVNHGADSVYIGGPGFGAREAAGNSLDDIARLVAYAHLFRVKVYVTLNTLLTDAEIEEAARLAHRLYEIGVDALIVQDLGLLEADLPPIPLHASTQMDNRSPEKVGFLEQLGFAQLVLARELSLAELRLIRANTTIRLECFVHGALCVSYSGRCQISEVMSGRSANRGECAQYCRHSYRLTEESGRALTADHYLLSLKDLNLSSYLGELVEAGVDAFKIEGRLKGESYVKNITAFYRQKLDLLLNNSPSLKAASSGHCSFSFVPDPERTFHRGQTSYFVRGEQADAAEIRSPKSKGKLLGNVVAVKGRDFRISGNEQIVNGDGLCYFDANDVLVGLRVNSVNDNWISSRDAIAVPLGTAVYRNLDVTFNKLLAASRQCRQLRVRLTLCEVPDGLELVLVDEDGIRSSLQLKVAPGQASQPGKVSASAEKQLRKSGGSNFIVTEVLVTIDPAHHYPAAVFNRMRRDGLAHHEKIRLAQLVRQVLPIVTNEIPWPRQAVDGAPHCVNRYAQRFFARHGVAVEVDSMPRQAADGMVLMTTKYCVRAQLEMCPRIDKRLGRAVPLILADKVHRYRLEFNCRRCEMQVRCYRPEDERSA